MPKLALSFKDILESVNYSTFLIASLAAAAALWLNSIYVTKEVYDKDKEIILLKVANLEQEANTLRFLVNQNQSRISEVAVVLTKLEALISKLISDDGEVILSKEMKQLEIDIAEIKKDIHYIKLNMQ